jgi:hypothetical protein
VRDRFADDAVNELRFDKNAKAVLDAAGGPRPAEDETEHKNRPPALSNGGDGDQATAIPSLQAEQQEYMDTLSPPYYSETCQDLLQMKSG